MTNRGGAWLFEDAPRGGIFTPEQLTDEHHLIADTADAFVRGEVAPVIDRLEQRDWSLARELMHRCGGLGLLGTDTPERFGGVALDKVSSFIVGESVGRVASFGTTFGGQVGLTIMPLLLYGTEAQKACYLPRLVSGKLIGAYALSEASSGSDALGARTRATRQSDGGFVLNGEKLWTTNGAFADLFVVFAKVDGDNFTAFLVERGFPGVTNGPDEHKLGLHGSSTTSLLLQDVVVPAGSVLGEVGKGHKVAFNVLNYGRFKLAAMCNGGAREAIAEAVRYASERRQFGRPIVSYGTIRHKLADMAIRALAVESMLYRAAGLLDGMIGEDGSPGALVAALEAHAVEASILKIAGSEMLDFVVDENVQIHGGNGFVRDYPAERRYRDARVNRIFEGTNEINRLLIAGLLIRRVKETELARYGPRTPEDEPPRETGSGDLLPLAAERRQVAGMKQRALLVLESAVQTFGDTVTEEQEILTYTADILIATFAAESGVLRASQAGGSDTALAAAARVTVRDAADRVGIAARTALAAMGEAPAVMAPIVEGAAVDTIGLRRQIADAVVRRVGYPF